MAKNDRTAVGGQT